MVDESPKRIPSVETINSEPPEISIVLLELTPAKVYAELYSLGRLVITKLLIWINIAIYFISLLLQFIGYDIFTNFALNKYYVKSGEIYRLLTCGFLHADIIHLFTNMYSLNILGTQMESFIGKKRFLIVSKIIALLFFILVMINTKVLMQ